VAPQVIRESLNPIARKKFKIQHLEKERIVAFRVLSNS